MSGILLMVRRSLRQHLLATTVTILSTALGSGLVMAVFSLSAQSKQAFEGVPSGFNAVLGARGSELQLVLNTVFHLETSPGNIPWSLYEEIKGNRLVELAIPYAVGDNYHGYRIVGTTPDYFDKVEYREGEKFKVRGRFFDPLRRQAVVGSYVAQQLGLQLGQIINPYHGLTFDPSAIHADEFHVVGILEPTNSPADRVIWIPLEGVFRMSGHVLADGSKPKMSEAIPDEYKAISAVMLKLRRGGGMRLSQTINRRGSVATLAWPINRVMLDFFKKLGWMNDVLRVVAYLVVVVAGAGILASIYNTIQERRREFAILRALGARRATVFTAIVSESAVIAGLGAVLGYVVYGAVLLGAASIIRTQTGVVIDLGRWHDTLWQTPLGMIGIGALAGVLPAYKAYSTDVASNLIPAS